MSTPPLVERKIRSAVRRNAIWAGGAAAIMLYYAAKGFGHTPDELAPDGVRLGQSVQLYAIPLGAGLMVLSTVFSLTGIRFALLFDALASMCIGLSLALAGGLLLSDMKAHPILLLLFAALFVYTGYRNWREYDSFAAEADQDEAGGAPDEKTAIPQRTGDSGARAHSASAGDVES